MHHPVLDGAAVLALLATITACGDVPAPPPTGPEVRTAQGDRLGPNVVNVSADHLEFVTSAEEIGAGWTTFRFKNHAHMPHFFAIEKLPVFQGEQITVEDYVEELAPAFQNLMDLIIGRDFTFPDVGLAFPAWAATFVGGPGLTSPGGTSQTTLWLDPGVYAIECYVKLPDGTFHTTEGMVDQIVVREEGNAAGAPPRPSLRLTLSSVDGFTVEGEIERPGTHTVQVHFEDQTVYSNFVGHDVHVARLDGDTDLSEVAEWMDWSVPTAAFPVGGLTSPAPATFLGGAQESPAGATTYFTVHLEKGEYALIAEVPDPAGRGMLTTFTVQ